MAEKKKKPVKKDVSTRLFETTRDLVEIAEEWLEENEYLPWDKNFKVFNPSQLITGYLHHYNKRRKYFAERSTEMPPITQEIIEMRDRQFQAFADEVKRKAREESTESPIINWYPAPKKD